MTTISTFPVFEKQKPKIIVYALKCDSVSPLISHPNNYFKKDKIHFIKLWQKAQSLKAKLVLVNYSPAHKSVKRIWVKKFDAELGITSQVQSIISQKQCKQWLNDLKKTYIII